MAPPESQSKWFIPSLEELLRLGDHPLRQCFWHHSRPKKGILVRCRKNIKGSDLATRTSTIRQIPDIAETEADYHALKALAPLVICALHRKPSDRVNEIYEYWISELKIRSSTDIRSKPILPYSNNDQDYSSSQATLATSSEELHQQVPQRHQNLSDLAPIQHGENSRQLLARSPRNLQDMSRRSLIDSSEEPPRATTRANPRQPDIPANFSVSWEDLGVSTMLPTQCHGKSQNGNGCRNTISKGSISEILAIKSEIEKVLDTPENALEILKKLATLIMCRRSHQDQAASRVESWIGLIRRRNEALRAGQTVRYPSPPQTPTRNLGMYRRLHTSDLEESDADTPESIESFWSSNRQNQSPESIATTPEHGPFPEDNSNSPLAQKQTRRGSKYFTSGPTATAPQMQTKSMTVAEPPSPSPSPSIFKPLKNCPKSAPEALSALLETLNAPLSPTDLKPGYIYGFRRVGCDLIKIGRAASVEERLKEWGTQCRYVPQKTFSVETQYVQRVEHLIQRQLYKYRRREVLKVLGEPDKQCNDGNGCTRQHQEWFEGVSDKYAEAVAQAWANWIKCEQPYIRYDNEYCLKEVWLEEAKLLDLSAGGDIWMKQTRSTLVSTTKIELESSEQTGSESTIKLEEAIESQQKDQYELIKSEITQRVEEIEPGEDDSQEGVLAQVTPVSGMHLGVVVVA
jgi:hypothetical protein